MVKKYFERLDKLKETEFMAIDAKSRTSLQIVKCDFNELVFNKIFYLVVFTRINRPFTAKYTSEKLITK